MLAVLKCITLSVSAKASLSSTPHTGPHLSIFAVLHSGENSSKQRGKTRNVMYIVSGFIKDIFGFLHTKFKYAEI